jgi:L-asparaginase
LKNRGAILIIYTGGTIGMVHDPATAALIPFNFDHILSQVPELRRFEFKIDTLTFSPLLDSSEVTPAVWKELASIVGENYNSYDGFVILHGTDTMAYTASALSFMLGNLDKPVILTGSQLPIGMLRTDGKENLITSVEIASAAINGRAVVPEVSVYFENRLFRGNRTTKLSTEHFSAFDSPNYPPLAEAGIDIKYNTNSVLYPTMESKMEVLTGISDRVAILKIFPGISPQLVNSVLSSPGLQGIVLESFGAGNAPTNDSFLNELEFFCKNGGIIINTTQCFKGSTNPSLYDTGKGLTDAGVLSGLDMTTEAAITKLMFLLGNYGSKGEIEKYVKKSMRGEITL